MGDKYIQALSKRAFSADAKSNVKKNVSSVSQENVKPVRYRSTIEDLLQSQEYTEIKQEQNAKFIIKRYDPGKMIAPAPALSTQKKKY